MDTNTPNTPPGSRTIEMPPALVIVSIIVVCSALATLILPQGAYERQERKFPNLKPYVVQEGDTLDSIRTATGGDFESIADLRPSEDPAQRLTELRPGQTVLAPEGGLVRNAVIPGTYQAMDGGQARGLRDQAWNALGDTVLAPIAGFVKRAEIIGFVLMLGGGFGVILATGAIDDALRWMVLRLGDSRAKMLVVPVSFALFSLGGAVFGLGESTIAFVLITVPLAIRLGYDTITGVAMCYMASQVGFGAAFFNPFTVGIAQSIAELPYLSGSQLRYVIWAICTTVGALFVTGWAWRVEKNPQRSPTFALDEKVRARLGSDADDAPPKLSLRKWLVVAIAFGSVAASGYGVAQLGWYIQEMAGLFVVCGVAAGLLHGYPLKRVSAEFIEGAKMMAEPCLIIALSAGVVSVLEGGRVLDTILHGLAEPLNRVGPEFAAVLLMGVQAVLNFFVPSGSGQAAMTMPIVTPLCDIIGLHRQIGVLAYQFGDGFTNLVVPTSAVLMGVLGAARVSWGTWVKWVAPLVALLYAVAAVILLVVVRGPATWLQ